MSEAYAFHTMNVTPNYAEQSGTTKPSLSLSDAVKQGLDNYFRQLAGVPPTKLYDLVLETVEEPLLRTVMRQTNNNQVQAAKLLGIARGTLRTRLKKYGMID